MRDESQRVMRNRYGVPIFLLLVKQEVSAEAVRVTVPFSQISQVSHVHYVVSKSVQCPCGKIHIFKVTGIAHCSHCQGIRLKRFFICSIELAENADIYLQREVKLIEGWGVEYSKNC